MTYVVGVFWTVLWLFVFWIGFGETSDDWFWLKKCCPANEAFDYDQRQCVISGFANRSMLFRVVAVDERFGKSVVGMPECSVSVDYEVDLAHVSVRKNKMELKHRKDSINLDLKNGLYCIDQNARVPSNIVVRVCQEENYCSNNICISQCDKRGTEEILKKNHNARKAQTNLHTFISRSDSKKFEKFQDVLRKTEDYGQLVKSNHCSIDYYVNDKWRMTMNGYIRVKNHRKVYKYHRYCLDVVENDRNETNVELIVCLQLLNRKKPTIFIVRGAVIITSCIFIFLTIIVNQLVPAFRSTYGKCLLRLLISYFGYFLGAIFIHFRVFKTQSLICQIWGYMTLYFNVSIFTWLNILCYLIWSRIGRQFTATTSTIVGDGEEKHIIRYFAIYGWGCPAILLMVALICDFNQNIAPLYKPNIGMSAGDAGCWFPHVDNYGEYIFFTIPTSIFLGINMIFFILTFVNFNKTKHDLKQATNKYSTLDAFTDFKKQFYINLKLLFIMGIPLINNTIIAILWYFDSDIFNSKPSYVLGMLVKAINSLQGITLFLILVLNEKVLKQLKSKLSETFLRKKNSPEIS